MAPERTSSPPNLPPHRGRKADLEILRAPPASHAITVLPAPRPGDGLAHRIFVARPHLRRVAHPAIYLLDGNAAFDFLTPAMLEAVPELLVIGVGYATDDQFARGERVFDYTPPPQPGGTPAPDPHHPGRLAGGAEGFLGHLTGPLRVLAEADTPVDPARRTLWGHSFGALCVLAAAAHHPGAFTRYALASPSVWWDEPRVRHLASTVAFSTPTPVHIGLGDREQRTGSSGPPPEGPPPATLRLADTLRGRPGVDLALDVHAGAGHIATLPATLPGALQLAAQPIRSDK